MRWVNHLHRTNEKTYKIKSQGSGQKGGGEPWGKVEYDHFVMSVPYTVFTAMNRYIGTVS